jgi:hypothetical protein
LPSNKGTDVRLQKRIFALLRIVPIIKSSHRKLLVLGKETSVIADLEDLQEVLSITQNFEGIPKYKIEFFNNVFYTCYKVKNGIPDSSKDGTKKEDRAAVTARQLCEEFKKVKGKSITTDNVKKTYLAELMSNGLVDYEVKYRCQTIYLLSNSGPVVISNISQRRILIIFVIEFTPIR